jgi:predicted transcriptional regulator
MEITFTRKKAKGGVILEPSKMEQAMKNEQLRKDIREVLKRHKVKKINDKLQQMDGAGLFDTIVSVGKKAIEYGKKGYDFYKKNQKTIDEGERWETDRW